MNPRTTLLLFLIVSLLGGAVWWQTRREESGEFDFVPRLFEGLDPQRLVAVRIDNLERSTHMKFERAGGLSWAMTDPIAYPADMSILKVLLEAITQNRIVALPDSEIPLAEPGFEPPRAIVEVTERFADGREIVRLVELGELDIDGQSVIVRRDGRYYKTLRNLDNCLQHSVDRYRSKEIFRLDVRDVVEVRREGSLIVGDRATDLGMTLQRRGLDWRLEAPMRVLADPEIVNLFLVGLATMKVVHFSSEDPSFAKNFGLDRPDLRLTLITRQGLEQTVAFARPRDTGPWHARREGLPHIWELDDDAGGRLSLAASRFFNLEFVRTLRSAVERVEIRDGADELRIVRDDDGWLLAERSDQSPEWSVDVPAESSAVDALLTRMESARLTRYLLEADPQAVFEDGPRRSIHVVQAGEPSGGRIGGVYHSPEGSDALYFLRDDDWLVGLLPVEFEMLFDESLATLRSRRMLRVEEVDLRRLTLGGGGTERVFRRSMGGAWQYMDMDAEALELRPVLDALFFLRAERFVDGPRADWPALEGAIDVALVDRHGQSQSARIGRTAGGEVQAEAAGARAVLVDQGLLERLQAVLDKKEAAAAGG